MKLFGFSASLRKGSFNTQLLATAATLLRERGHAVELAPLRDFAIPLYDGDVEENDGIPAGVERLAALIAGAQAVVIASPEYNGGISGVLKNTIDWLSRTESNPLVKKPCLLLSASPGAFGGVRSHPSVRAPFDALGAFLYPQPFALPMAHQALDAAGPKLKDEKTQGRLVSTLEGFSTFAQALAR